MAETGSAWALKYGGDRVKRVLMFRDENGWRDVAVFDSYRDAEKVLQVLHQSEGFRSEPYRV